MIIIRNDITKILVEVVVNSTNLALKMDGGVCGAIFAAAGAQDLQEECDRINIKGVSLITEKDYFVRGSATLLDAIGRTIQKITNAQRHTVEN